MKLKLILLFLFSITFLNATSVETNKEKYKNNENITVTFSEMGGNAQDWIGIYKENDNNDWENIVQWDWTNGKVNGSTLFNGLKTGKYEVRLFLNNSFELQATFTFEVEEGELEKANVETSKDNYKIHENIIITISNMIGDNKDWIGIYKAESSNDWGNVIAWKWTSGKVNAQFSFTPLDSADYEIRLFSANSFNLEAKYAFSIDPQAEKTSTIYDDAEDGISDEWIQVSGNFAPSLAEGGFDNSDGTIALVPEWINRLTNLAYYTLPLNENHNEKFLEMDMGGLPDHLMWHRNGAVKGNVAHYGVGVVVQTTLGQRRMMWDSFFNHGNVEAFKEDNGNDNIWLYYPSPVEHVRGWGYEATDSWLHFKVDIQGELQKIEPYNEIISVDHFIATGGLFDNLKLSSH